MTRNPYNAMPDIESDTVTITISREDARVFMSEGIVTEQRYNQAKLNIIKALVLEIKENN